MSTVFELRLGVGGNGWRHSVHSAFINQDMEIASVLIDASSVNFVFFELGSGESGNCSLCILDLEMWKNIPHHHDLFTSYTFA
ncbi:unnamed protein product [Allacma fusca]|uniref:Uncharacterized protein n=1 Tax=Allacma fusca TaxID=39272 RepID=A0A8J2P4W3_9HEXA|nr:unnamed protein product [Allacma fusca]